MPPSFELHGLSRAYWKRAPQLSFELCTQDKITPPPLFRSHLPDAHCLLRSTRTPTPTQTQNSQEHCPHHAYLTRISAFRSTITPTRAPRGTLSTPPRTLTHVFPTHAPQRTDRNIVTKSYEATGSSKSSPYFSSQYSFTNKIESRGTSLYFTSTKRFL